jgi:uncharacterized OsmC-like protein
MAQTLDIVYQGSLRSLATWGDGTVTLIADAPLEHGGLGASFAPTDLVAVALGTCLMSILGAIAERSGLDLIGTTVRVVKEMAAKPLRRIGRLQVTITFPEGRDYPAEIREKFQRAMEHCPVRQSLHPDIQESVELVYPG